jgi:CRP/FNR family transcriptional regulator, cyclic AMP receptor protein
MTDDLARFPLLRGLSAAQRAKVWSTAQEVSIAAHHRIFDEGQDARRCWLIRSGQVALDTTVPGRGLVVVQTLGAGDVLGWSWLVPPRRWHFGAVTLDPVRAVEIDTVRLSALADADPALGYRLALGLFEAVLARLQNTRARLLDLYGSPRER